MDVNETLAHYAKVFDTLGWPKELDGDVGLSLRDSDDEEVLEKYRLSAVLRVERDSLREKLAERRVEVRLSNIDDPAIDGAGACWHIEPDHMNGKCLHYDDYDEALTAAARLILARHAPENGKEK